MSQAASSRATEAAGHEGTKNEDGQGFYSPEALTCMLRAAVAAR